MTIMTLTTIKPTDIPADGLHLEGALTAEEIALSADDARVQDGLELSADVMKMGSSIHVSGMLAATFVRQCVRCLKEYTEPARIAFRAEYRSESSTPRSAKPQDLRARQGSKARPGRTESESDEQTEDDGDSYPYAGDSLDLAEMLREHIILATPMQPLCTDTCRGLCPVCGRDRNVAPCGCVEQTTKSPFAVLRDLEMRRNDPGRTS